MVVSDNRTNARAVVQGLDTGLVRSHGGARCEDQLALHKRHAIPTKLLYGVVRCERISEHGSDLGSAKRAGLRLQ
jgi:hypothetical protein